MPKLFKSKASLKDNKTTTKYLQRKALQEENNARFYKDNAGNAFKFTIASPSLNPDLLDQTLQNLCALSITNSSLCQSPTIPLNRHSNNYCNRAFTVDQCGQNLVTNPSAPCIEDSFLANKRTDPQCKSIFPPSSGLLLPLILIYGGLAAILCAILVGCSKKPPAVANEATAINQNPLHTNAIDLQPLVSQDEKASYQNQGSLRPIN